MSIKNGIIQRGIKMKKYKITNKNTKFSTEMSEKELLYYLKAKQPKTKTSVIYELIDYIEKYKIIDFKNQTIKILKPSELSWKTKDGKTMPISNMNIVHITNTINYLKRTKPENINGGTYKEWISIFFNEINRRQRQKLKNKFLFFNEINNTNNELKQGWEINQL